MYCIVKCFVLQCFSEVFSAEATVAFRDGTPSFCIKYSMNYLGE